MIPPAAESLEVPNQQAPAVVMLSGAKFVLACAVVAAVLALMGRATPLPVWLLALEVSATILALFLLGSFKYQIHKNALTYGLLLVIVATFSGLQTSQWHIEIVEKGWSYWAQENLLTLSGLDSIVHADTMLFILGLTFFVSVIAQTRLLEDATFFLLRRSGGAILPTVISITAVVAAASGVLDGVSMIGLTIRTLVIILMLAALPKSAIRFAVVACTTVTTICGVWLAYGEPPNLIMKANLHPHLGNMFFLEYCAPIAIASYLVLARHLRKRLRGKHVDLHMMDVIDANAANVRFLQAARHGEVLTPVELIEDHAANLGSRVEPLLDRIRNGESLGLALVREDVPPPVRKKLLAHFVSEDLAASLDRHYELDVAGDQQGMLAAEQEADEVLAVMGSVRKRAKVLGILAFVPFVALLIVHGMHHEVPLFLASFAGFFLASLGILRITKMRQLAVREAWREYAEYYFLFPLFLSITLLSKANFFDGVQSMIRHSIASLGQSHVAFGQFLGCTFLSAILDNNVVADFASHALHGLDISVLSLFAMAQISGYALGGCWTHIGSAQSVVAYAFIQRDVDVRYTPVDWIKDMTPIMVEMLVVIGVLVYVESAFLRYWH